ncbi:MAG: hypothetical protein VKL59_02365 [Nostocaceae cyanobacterium]|nr:hypothetical protein [Nostocaceae cyanobacterium]
MKMSFFTDKSLLNKAKIVGKILVVFILSVLLFVPTPALALDYNGTLQTYVSNTKVEIDGVLTSIKKLSSLSYENGKTTLAEVDDQLHKIKTDAGNNAEYFKNLSNNYQISYENNLKNLNQLYLKQQYLEKMGFPPSNPISSNFVGLSIKHYEEQNQNFSKVIVLTNKISQLCDDLEKRINLAKQKSGNVKEYADELLSFSDPEILGEISELDKFVADLTKNLSLGT